MIKSFITFYILLTAHLLLAQGPYDNTYDGPTITIPAGDQTEKVFIQELNITDS